MFNLLTILLIIRWKKNPKDLQKENRQLTYSLYTSKQMTNNSTAQSQTSGICLVNNRYRIFEIYVKTKINKSPKFTLHLTSKV